LYQYRNLLVIHEIYRQQRWMYENRCHRISDRIVSISQPHVRPIVRGKASASTEFGAKLSASLVDGFVFLDHLDWNSFNKSGDLIEQVKTYKQRFGCYPESVHCDKIYRTRDNRKFCKSHSIRISGPPLGRPPKVTTQNADALKAEKLQQRQDELDRIPIEGKFGQGKRRFGLSRIMAKLSKTSETVMAIMFIVMNLEKWLKLPFFVFVLWLRHLMTTIYDAAVVLSRVQPRMQNIINLKLVSCQRA
jgi:IS5 family transposase